MSSKLTTILVMAMVFAGYNGCSSDPDYSCNIPEGLRMAKPGSYWIYERFLIDARGNHISSLPTYDSLVLLGDAFPAYEKDGVKALALVNFGIDDLTLKPRMDTLFWIITSYRFYASTGGPFSPDPDPCSVCGLMAYRAIGSCDLGHVTLADTSESYNLPNLVIDIKTNEQEVRRIQTKTTLYNIMETVGEEPFSVKGANVRATICYSQIRSTNEITSPDNVVFTSNRKRAVHFTDFRTVWTNKDYGLLRERVHFTEDGDSTRPYYRKDYERSLVRVSILM